jgi:hypothetical protein
VCVSNSAKFGFCGFYEVRHYGVLGSSHAGCSGP